MVASINLEQNGSPTAESIWRLSVTQYHSMIAYGVLAQDSQVELLEGLLIAKMPKNPRHRLSRGLLQDALLSVMPAGYHLNLQEPITLIDSEPEPDLALIIGNRIDYCDRHPNAKEVELVVEVADSSLERDRSLKQKIYARSGIPTYWILNLSDRVLEIYSQPGDQGLYGKSKILTTADLVNLIINHTEVATFRVGSFF